MNLDSYFHPLLLLPIFTKVCCELFQHFCFVLPMCRFFKLVPSSLSTNFLLQFLYVQGKKKKKGTAKPPLWLAWLMMCEAWATQSQAEYGAFRPSRSRHITSLQIFCWILLCPICLIFHLLPVFPTIGWVFRVAKEKKRSKEGEFTVDRFQYRVLSIEDSVLHTWSPAKKNWVSIYLCGDCRSELPNHVASTMTQKSELFIRAFLQYLHPKKWAAMAISWLINWVVSLSRNSDLPCWKYRPTSTSVCIK